MGDREESTAAREDKMDFTIGVQVTYCMILNENNVGKSKSMKQ